MAILTNGILGTGLFIYENNFLNNLSGYWKFENNVSDYSGNNLNGVSFGSPVVYDVGKFDSAILLSSTTNYVTVNSNPLLLPRDSNIFTISCWIKLNQILVSEDFIYLFDWGQSLTTDSSDMSFSLTIRTGGTQTYLVSKFPTREITERNMIDAIGKDTNWHHLAIRVKEYILPFLQVVEIFIDGVRYNDIAYELNPNYELTTNNLRIGYNTGSTKSFDIDDLSIWQRDLSNEEISYLYTSNRPLF